MSRFDNATVTPGGVLVFLLAVLVFLRIIPVEHSIDPDLATLALFGGGEALQGFKVTVARPPFVLVFLICTMWIVGFIVALGAVIGEKVDPAHLRHLDAV